MKLLSAFHLSREEREVSDRANPWGFSGCAVQFYTLLFAEGVSTEVNS